MGSAAVYQLAKRGCRVLGLDRFSPPHTYGSIHGDSRITRRAVVEGEAYIPLVLRSHELWREIEQATGQSLLTITGGLIMSGPERTAAWHGATGFLNNTIALAQKYGIAHELLSTAEIRRRFGSFILQGNETGYFEPGAGFLRPERCVAAQIALARQLGAAVQLNERVLEITPAASGDVGSVRTVRGSYTAEQIIISAGAWLPEFLAPSYARSFQIFRQVVSWFELPAEIAPYLPDNFPIYIWIFGDGPDDLIYGFPAIDGPHGGIKVGTEHYHDLTTAETSDRTVTTPELEHIYHHAVAPHLRGIGPRAIKSVSCLYTVTPDHGFVIDRLPHFPNVIIASPCSGHGFKHSAAVGEILAELVTTGTSTIDISSFQFARFKGASP
ncbi:MAG: N-methyl-L-tryptophan oxidase [Herpetosiphonaceae bacterium]|nr:N-methyl-L-tryptophan oxidase [Herpetosiphonaceae bacterium]